MSGYFGASRLGSRLPERQQLQVVESLCAKCDTALTKGQFHRAVCCLVEVAHIVTSLGDAAASVSESLQAVALKALNNKTRVVRLEAAATLRALARPLLNRRTRTKAFW